MNGNASNAVVAGGRDGARLQIASWARSIDPGPFPPDLLRHVPDVIGQWKQTLRPLKLVEPRLDGSETRKVKAAFLPLGAKQQPGMDDSKATVWTNALVAALSDLPARCIVKAMNEALHHVFRFPSDMEEWVRSRASSNLDSEVACITRLRNLLNASFGEQRPLQLEQRDDPMTREEIRQLVRTATPFNAALIRMGLGCGSIDATLLAQVRREEGLDDEADE